MSFRIAARTILHLGAELISSDAIALYELIKNAFDAKSPEVEIRVFVTLQQNIYQDLINELNQILDIPENVATFKKTIFSKVESSAPQKARDVLCQCLS
jgi:hypothetical protein